MTFGKALLYGFVIAVLTFLIIPTLIVIPLSFSPTTIMRFPPESLSFQWYEKYWTQPGWVAATWNSVIIAVITPFVAVPIGSLAAYALVRGTFIGRKAISFFMLLPIIVPTLVTAIAIFKAFSQVKLSGTIPGFVIAHSILAIPFVVTIMTATLKGVDPQLENAAMTLGASRIKALRLVTLPIAAPGLFASSLFSFLVSFDELIVAIFLSSPLLNTLPKRLWDGIRLELEPILAAVSSILVLVSLIVLALAAALMRRANAKV